MCAFATKAESLAWIEGTRGAWPLCRPHSTGQKGEYILSTYSYALNKPYLTCPAGGDRTVCFGYPCIIDEKGPKRAHCTCPIVYGSNKEFKTRGGDCNVCSHGLLQGGAPAEYDLINKIFTKATGQPAPSNCAAIVKPK